MMLKSKLAWFSDYPGPLVPADAVTFGEGQTVALWPNTFTHKSTLEPLAVNSEW